MRAKMLRIEIPATKFTLQDFLSIQGQEDDDGQSLSLFSELSEPDSLFDDLEFINDTSPTTTAARRQPRSPPGVASASALLLMPASVTAPPIPGLFFDPTVLLPEDFAESIMKYCLDTYFRGGANQVMLFGRCPSNFVDGNAYDVPSLTPDQPPSGSGMTTSGFPPPLVSLLSFLPNFLRPLLPPATYELLFPDSPTQARQAIINLYHPGEGITPHVDLLKRYGDGIIGVSLGGSCVMQFAKSDPWGEENGEMEAGKSEWGLYLPERSVLVLSEDARYKWTHGIDRRKADLVAGTDDNDDGSDQRTMTQNNWSLSGDVTAVATQSSRWIERRMRLSVTYRWLLPGADVVGN